MDSSLPTQNLVDYISSGVSNDNDCHFCRHDQGTCDAISIIIVIFPQQIHDFRSDTVKPPVKDTFGFVLCREVVYTLSKVILRVLSACGRLFLFQSVLYRRFPCISRF